MFVFDVSISWAITLSLAGLSIFWLWIMSRRSYSKYNIPPFPVKPWPIVGHFFSMFGRIRDKIKEWREAAGDIYSLDIAGQLNILVHDFSDIKEIWVKRADFIVNTHVSLGDELLNEYDTGLLGARDDNWKEQRTVSLTILRNFGMGKNIIAEKIQEEVAFVIDKLSGFKGQPENVKLLFNVSVSNIICSIAVGKRFDHDDPYFVNLIVHLGTYMKYFNTMLYLEPFKRVYYLPWDLFHAKEWVRSATSVNEGFSKHFIDKFKKQFNSSEEPQNFIVAYLKEMKKLNEKGMRTNLDERNLVSVIKTLFSAGTDTTSATIIWCLLYLLNYPKIQEKVYHEIETIVGTERRPNVNDKPKLTYLNAVIMETQRMSIIFPIGLQREVSETFEYRGFVFPKGSKVWPILDSVVHEKKIWGDPENFRPERFIDENGALLKPEEFIPFGIGRRVCMGESLAKMELFLFLSAIFQRFKLEPEDKSCELPTLKECSGTLLEPHPFKIRFIDRLTKT